MVWSLLALGFAFGFLPRSRPARVAAIPFAAICLLALWTALQLSWTQSDERTFAELARYLHYTGLLLLIWSVVDVRNWRAAAAGLVFAALAVVVLAVASRLDPGAFPTNYVNRSLNVDRLSYPFNYWNAVGAWAVMALSAALVISAHARQLALRAATLALVPVCGAAIYLSYSRAAFIGAALAFLLVLVFSHNRWVALAHEAAAAAGSVLVVLVIHNKPQIANATGNAGAGAVVLALVGAAVICAAAAALTWQARGDARWRLPRRTARIGLAAAVVLVLVAVPTAGHSAISKGWHQFRHEPNHPVSADPTARLANLNGTRYFIWRGAVRAFDHKPIKGLGSGTFEFWWNYNGGNEFVRDAHSIYLESFAEGGLPGGLLTLTLLAGLAVGGILTRRRLGVHGRVGTWSFDGGRRHRCGELAARAAGEPAPRAASDRGRGGDRGAPTAPGTRLYHEHAHQPAALQPRRASGSPRQGERRDPRRALGLHPVRPARARRGGHEPPRRRPRGSRPRHRPRANQLPAAAAPVPGRCRGGRREGGARRLPPREGPAAGLDLLRPSVTY